jgi:hypothetical protein
VTRAGCIYTFDGEAAHKHGSTLNDAHRVQSSCVFVGRYLAPRRGAG